jgi:hypothetical protein
MGPEFGLDEPADFFLDGISRKGWGRWGFRFPPPGEAILRIKAVLPAHGFITFHEDARIPADITVERVHTPRGTLCCAHAELLMGGEPALMGNELQAAGVNHGLQVNSQFAFRRNHHAYGPQLRDHWLERGPVGTVCYHVSDGNAAGCLLQGEVPEVGQDKGELLLMVWAPLCFPRVFHEHNTDSPWVFPGKGADAV